MASKRKKSKKEVEFSWNDDQLQLLLQVALNYKAKCQFNAENWEKYKNIFNVLMKEYPDEKEKYSNKEKMNIERVAAKLKSTRSGLKKAIDCSKKKGWRSCSFYFFQFL